MKATKVWSTCMAIDIAALKCLEASSMEPVTNKCLTVITNATQTARPRLHVLWLSKICC